MLQGYLKYVKEKLTYWISSIKIDINWQHDFLVPLKLSLSKTCLILTLSTTTCPESISCAKGDNFDATPTSTCFFRVSFDWLKTFLSERLKIFFGQLCVLRIYILLNLFKLLWDKQISKMEMISACCKQKDSINSKI